MSPPRHFTDINRVDAAALRTILNQARDWKAARPTQGKALPDDGKPLDGKLLAMIFERPSTRTRISFDVGMRQLGGQTIVIDGNAMQIERGETPADTARVLSRYVDAIMVRCKRHGLLQEMAANATVPVINGLTDMSHPCQLMADVMTLEERRGDIAGQIVAWSGDGNNMANSWIHGAARFGYELRLACPEQLPPDQAALDWSGRHGGRVRLMHDPERAVEGADCVVTDTWVSMHDDPRSDRHNLLAPYQVNARLMRQAKPDAVFMHCLPAHRGHEVTDEVMDGPQSVVWDQAENRLHVQKGILAWCLS